MTDVIFYFHVADRIAFAARLAAKAYSQRRTIRLFTQDPAMTAALGTLLWTENPIGFFPHCGLGHPLASKTPIIVDDLLEHQGLADVLINLHSAPPPFFGRFCRLAEIVTDEEEVVHAARDRWRFYSARGYPMQRHDMAGRN